MFLEPMQLRFTPTELEDEFSRVKSRMSHPLS